MNNQTMTAPATPTTGSDVYAQAGVNLDAGDAFGGFTGELCRKSWGNSEFVRVEDWSRGHFRGPRPFYLQGRARGLGMLTAPDGIGTKTVIISAAHACDSAPSNLLEMTACDNARWGALSIIIINHLEVHTLGKPGSPLFMKYQSMLRNLALMAKDQRYVLINGETAQMGVCVSSEWNGKDEGAQPVFNWSAVALAVVHPDKRIDGSTLAPGQRIMALRDNLRSNGASLCREYLQKVYGHRWWENPDAGETVAAMAKPSALYSLFLATINGWHDSSFKTEIPVHAIAHLSGGGIESKLGKGLIFPRSFNVVLDNLWEPPRFMKDCVAWKKEEARRIGKKEMSDEEAYRVFNGGQGALVVVDEAYAAKFQQRAAEFGLEARDAGYIESQTPEGGSITVVSKFSGEQFVIKGD